MSNQYAYFAGLFGCLGLYDKLTDLGECCPDFATIGSQTVGIGLERRQCVTEARMDNITTETEDVKGAKFGSCVFVNEVQVFYLRIVVEQIGDHLVIFVVAPDCVDWPSELFLLC